MLLLTLSYAAIGLVAGLLTSLVARGASGAHLFACAVIPLALAVLMNHLFTSTKVYAAFGIVCALTVLGWAISSIAGSRGVPPLKSPWAAVLDPARACLGMRRWSGAAASADRIGVRGVRRDHGREPSLGTLQVTSRRRARGCVRHGAGPDSPPRRSLRSPPSASPQPHNEPAQQGDPLRSAHVVLIVMDSVRADHLSAYGYKRETTPNLRELARHATLYRRAIATGDMTLPSHGSIFTGLYPSWHGAFIVKNFGQVRGIDPGHRTLAEAVSASGYRTIAVVGNHGYVVPKYGMARGFELFDVLRPVSFRDGVAYKLGLSHRLAPLVLDASALDYTNRAADEITDRALSSAGEAKAHDEPFLLFLNYMDAHVPYVPPAPFDTKFPGKDRSFRHEEFSPLLRRLHANGEPVPRAKLEHLISQYDGGIAFIDDQVGRLFRWLGKRVSMNSP